MCEADGSPPLRTRARRRDPATNLPRGSCPLQLPYRVPAFGEYPVRTIYRRRETDALSLLAVAFVLACQGGGVPSPSGHVAGQALLLLSVRGVLVGVSDAFCERVRSRGALSAHLRRGAIVSHLKPIASRRGDWRPAELRLAVALASPVAR